MIREPGGEAAEAIEREAAECAVEETQRATRRVPYRARHGSPIPAKWKRYGG